MASHATKHFIRQRFTALLQVPLSIFLVVSIILQAGSSREEVMAWVSTWWVAALLIAWFVSVPMHMSIGIGDVIDDYLHKKTTRSLTQSLNTIIALAVGLTGVFAVIAITLIA